MDVNKTEGLSPQSAPDKTIPEKPAMPEAEAPAATGAGRSFLSLRGDLDRLFDAMLVNPFGRRLFDSDLFRRGSLFGEVTPRLDMVETPAALEVTVELPGMKEEDIDITVGEGVVTIRGEKKLEREQTEGGCHLSERSYGSFSRTLPLPDTVDVDAIEASYDRGVLTLTMPKREPSEPARRKIEIKANKA